MPSRVLPIIASSEESTMDANSARELNLGFFRPAVLPSGGATAVAGSFCKNNSLDCYDTKSIIHSEGEPEAMRVRVLLGDDHAFILSGVRAALRPEHEVAGEAHDGRALVQAAERLKPDLVILDI